MAMDYFVVTLAIGMGLVISAFVGVIAVELARAWHGLLYAAESALRRYAKRDMIVRAYYEPEKMRHVREWDMPEPYLVELAKKGKVSR